MDVKPLHVILILVLFGGLLALALWGATESRRIQGPSDLRIDRLDRLHVRINRQIFVYNNASTLVDTYALDKFGIEQLLGSYDFYSDNSMLLSPASIHAPAGTDEFNEGATSKHIGKLLRCSLDSGACTALEKSVLSFKQSFRAFVDQADDIYLADTASGSVYWLNEEGGVRHELSRVLDRPSQIRRYDDVLVVAHTEGQELVLVPLRDGRFGDEEDWQRIAMTDPGNRTRSETRPIDFTRIEKDWYVLAKTQDMRSGAIYRYDPTGTLRAHFALPAGADPFALEDFGGAIVVADYVGMAVHRYSPAGDHLGYLSSTTQDEYVAGLKPRLERATALGPLQQTVWQWHNKRGVFIALLLGVIILLPLAIAVQGDWAKNRFEQWLQTQPECQVAGALVPHPQHTQAINSLMSPNEKAGNASD